MVEDGAARRPGLQWPYEERARPKELRSPPRKARRRGCYVEALSNGSESHSGKMRMTYHEQGPDGVVGEDGGCYDEHGEADKTVKLRAAISTRGSRG